MICSCNSFLLSVVIHRIKDKVFPPVPTPVIPDFTPYQPETQVRHFYQACVVVKHVWSFCLFELLTARLFVVHTL